MKRLLFILLVSLLGLGQVWSQKPKIGWLTANGQKESYDDKLVSAFDDYDIAYLTASSTAPSDILAFYADYDLIVIHSSVGGNNATAVATKAMVGVKPVLNLKPFTYTDNNRWNWAAPSNTVAGIQNVNVATNLQNHILFSGLTFSGEALTLYSSPTPAVNNIQTVAFPFTGSGWNAAWNDRNYSLATYNNATQMHEINVDNAAKYIMIGVSQESNAFTLFSDDMVQMVKNAVVYLLNTNGYYDYSTNTVVGFPSDNEILSLNVNGVPAEIGTSSGMAAVTLPTADEYTVTYTLSDDTYAKADFVSGNTHDFSNGPLLINVRAGNGEVKTYTVYVKTPPIATEKKKVGWLTVNGQKESYDDKLVSAFDDYDITYLTASSTAPSDIPAFYADYDLIVIHSSVGGNNATAVATKAMVGVKPVLNLKPFTYTDNNRWNWTAPSNTAAGIQDVNVVAALQNHIVFSGLTFNTEALTLYASPTPVANSIQTVGTLPFAGSGWNSAWNDRNHALATYNNATQMHEINVDNAAKYIMIGISNESNAFTLFSDDMVKMLKNAADYLTNPSVSYDYSDNKPVSTAINGLTVAGYPAVIDHIAGTVSVILPQEMGPLGSFRVVYTLDDVNAGTDVANGIMHDFSEGPFTITVTAGNGTSKIYTVTTEIEAFPFVVTLNPNGGALPDGVSNLVDVLQREPVGELPVPVRQGWTFLGWNLKQDGSDETFTESTIYNFDNDTTLYAQWSINTYTLSFNAHASGVTHPESRQIVYGTEIGELPVLTRPGRWKLLGWNTDIDGNGDYYTASTQYTVEGDVTLYAVWEMVSSNEDIEWAELKIYPNPATDVVSITGLEGKETIAFYDVAGRMWIQTKVSSAREEFTLTQLPKGTYLVKITRNDVEKVVKLIIQ